MDIPLGAPELDAGMGEGFDLFLRACMKQIVANGDSAVFLDWIAKNGLYLLPDIAAQIDSDSGAPQQFFRILGRAIWQAAPLPQKGFACEKLPEPGRNDPCICGSNRKYKQCCEQLKKTAEFGLPPLDMLVYLIDVLPKKRWKELAGSAVRPDSVAATAFQLLQNDRPEDAAVLLQPWFAGGDRWLNKLADLMDLLLDAYERLGKRKKRKDLAKAATERGERQVAAIGWQRLAVMLSDEGNLTAAWEAFNHAQRADPDNPALATLEITILLSQQKWDQAKQRAQFWAMRITRLYAADDMPELLDFLRRVATDPKRAMQYANARMSPPLARLNDLLSIAPAVACAYELEPQDGSAVPLTPIPALAQIEEVWRAAFPVRKPMLTYVTTHNEAAWPVAEQWLNVLEKHPMLWQSFDVLDDLVCALDGLNTLGLDEVIVSLTQRALTLFDCVLADQHAEGLPLEWPFMENRPALRLVARHIYDLLDVDDEAAAFPWLERMVNQLNPNDNHGLRDLLMQQYLKNGAFERAVALGDRYPDDFPTMRYNRALANFHAGQREKADAILADALDQFPLVADALLAKRAVKIKSDHVTVGSREEAQLYRERHLHLWSPDTLAWLAAVRKC